MQKSCNYNDLWDADKYQTVEVLDGNLGLQKVM
jgi:hypothetical protein